MGEVGNETKFLLERDNSEDIKMDLKAGWDLSGSEYGPVMGSCQHSNAVSGFMNRREFLEWLSNY
jgi:hypothetical protein